MPSWWDAKPPLPILRGVLKALLVLVLFLQSATVVFFFFFFFFFGSVGLQPSGFRRRGIIDGIQDFPTMRRRVWPWPASVYKGAAPRCATSHFC